MKTKPFDALWAAHTSTNRERGKNYQREGRVAIVEQTAHRVRALVKGSESYSVRLSLGPRGWAGSCTCVAHAERGQCKHVCAVIVEAQPRLLRMLQREKRGGGEHDEESVDGVDEAEFAHVVDPSEPVLHGEDELDDDELDHDEFEEPEPKLERRHVGKSPTPPIGRVVIGPDDPRFDLLDRLLGDRNMPDDVRRRLFADIMSGELRSADSNAKQREAARAQRLLAALETFAPNARAPQPTLALRYVLHARAPSSPSVRVDVQAARLDTKSSTRRYRPLSAPPHESELDELDRRASAVILQGPRESFLPTGFSGRSIELGLSPALQRLLLPELAEGARLWFARDVQAEPTIVLPDKGAPWHFVFGVATEASGFVLEGALERGVERIPLAEVDCVLAGGFAIAQNALFAVEWHGAHAWAAHLVGEAPLALGRERASDVRRILSRASVSMPIRAEGLVEDVVGVPRPVLTLAEPRDAKAPLQARIAFLYGAERARRNGPSVLVKGERVLRFHRDVDAEQRAVEAFVAAGGRLAAHDGGFDGTVAQKTLAHVVVALSESGWLVEGDGLKLRVNGAFDVSVRSGIDWFDVQADVRFDDAKLTLPALLEALAERRSLVRLSDGSLGVLPEEWLARWRSLAELGDVEDGVLRVKKARGFLLDVLLAEKLDARVDDGFRSLRERFARARAPAPLAEPAGFRGELRPYQRAGVGWLAFLGEAGLGGCLADDMGLGKTVQVLAHVVRRRPKSSGPTLVVAPMSLLFNWKSEAERFAPELDVRLHHGTARAKKAPPLEDADVVVTTYGTLLRDVKLLSDIHFDLVVLDEAQTIKNPASQSAKAARLLDADQHLALTGTPIENRMGDLLSIFEFLNPGLLEGSRALRGLLEAGDEVEAARFAARALGPFLLRRTKEEVLKDLPAKSEQVVEIELEGTQRREYDALKTHFQKTLLAKVDEVGLEKAGMNVLEALLRLRQAACHLALVDPDHAKTKSAKLDALHEMLDELRESGHKALVFSQFTSLLAIVRRELDARGVAYETLDGETRMTDRQERVERFQADATKSVFLISLKAGGVGLNLTSADYVFLLDPWWNPAVERQAIDRTHRIGQTRPVTAYRLVARDTVEEKVLALQAKKREVANALFEGRTAGLKGLTRGELEELLA